MKRNTRRRLRWVCSFVLMLPMFQFYSSCVTDLQVQDFVRSQAALALTNLLTSQVTAALNQLNQDLTGPQVTDELVLNPAGPN